MTIEQIEKYIQTNFKEGITQFETFGSKKVVTFKSMYYINKEDLRAFVHCTDGSDYCVRNYRGRFAKIINKH